MKKLLLHIVLISYAIVIIKPALPYVSDFIGHVLFYQQHLATVHFENGQYHLHNEVLKNAKEDDSNKSSLPEKKRSSSNYEYIATVNKLLLPAASLSSSVYAVYPKQHNISPYLSYNYPPPRV